jgi:zinc transporter ZupT
LSHNPILLKEKIPLKGFTVVNTIIAFLAGTAATFIPLYIGVFAPRFAPRFLGSAWKNLPLLLAASASGILFWFFLDVMGDAVLLDVNQSFGKGVTQDEVHLILILLFIIAIGVLFWLEKSLTPQSAESQDTTSIHSSTPSGSPSFRMLTYGIAVAAALAIGFHAFGEGIDIGAAIPSAPGILEAIGGSTTGGIYAGTAYVLHKLFEGYVVGVIALLASSVSSKRLGVLGLISGLPTIFGFIVGVLAPIDSSYFFALGGAGTVYAELRLVPVFADKDVKYVIVLALLLGFYAMYIAGLFHSLIPPG